MVRQAVIALVILLIGFGLGHMASETKLLGYGNNLECLMGEAKKAGNQAEFLKNVIVEFCAEYPRAGE